MREWRSARNLTLEQLAERVGVTFPYLSRIERGERQYNQRLLEDIALALNTTPAAILAQDPADAEGIWMIAEKIGRLPPASRQHALAILETFAKTGTDQ
jgi:XRE family aerobic/anaerobic benzoate catabolism transcriptional regulator